MMHLQQTLILSMCLLTATTNAEVFKCTGAAGDVIYQDTDCGAALSTTPIDTRYANTLPLGFTNADATLMRDMAADTSEVNAARISLRNKHIRQTAERLAAKAQACRQAKAAMTDSLAAQRRHGRDRPESARRLLQKMHDACSA